MSDNKIQAILDTTMDKLKAMVNADVITGDPIVVDGLTLIPVSKVAFGLATGGSDFPSKTDKQVFGGGGGAGVSINPMGVLVISGGNVKFVPINNEITSIDRLLQAAPEILDKIKGMTGKHEPTVY